VQKNQAHFTADIITDIFRVSTRGSAPNNNIFIDALLNFIAWVRNQPALFYRSILLDKLYLPTCMGYDICSAST
jgi:hypothetical protein